MKAKTNTEKVRRHLLAGYSTTILHAKKRWGLEPRQLHSIIATLKKEMSIDADMVERRVGRGDPIRVAEYKAIHWGSASRGFW